MKDDPEKYFYAKKKARNYDETIDSVVPNYSLIIQTVLEFINYNFNPNCHLKIQDIGAGTGNDSLPILMQMKNSMLLAFDLSIDMKSLFVENAKKMEISQGRYEYLIQDYLISPYLNEHFDLIISGYCIHHYELESKKKFFEKAFKETKKGGFFIVIDLMNFNTKLFSDYSHHYDLKFIKNSFNQILLGKRDEEKQHYIELRDNWVYHMNNENILDSTHDQLFALKDIGFKNVECIFKFLQHSVIIAQK